MSLADEIRNEIDNIKQLKIDVGDINNHLSVLEGLTRKDIEEREKEAYQKGINDGSLDVKQRVEGAYQRGLNDAWEAARKIFGDVCYGGLTLNVLSEIFGTKGYSFILQENTAQEAIDKIKAYDGKCTDSIEVGDEVATETGNKYTVVSFGTGGTVCGFNKEGKWTGWKSKEVTKTGKHYDIQSILEAMKS